MNKKKTALLIFGAAAGMAVGFFLFKSSLPSLKYLADEKITRDMKEFYKEQ